MPTLAALKRPASQLRSNLKKAKSTVSLTAALPRFFRDRVTVGADAARASRTRRARGEILAFLDDDCTVPSDYLRSIENVFTRYPETMIVQVGLERPQPKNIYGQAWKFALEQTLKNNLHRDENGRLTAGF